MNSILYVMVSLISYLVSYQLV